MILCASMAFTSLVACSSDNKSKNKKEKSDKKVESIEDEEAEDKDNENGKADFVPDNVLDEFTIDNMPLDAVNIKDYEGFKTKHNEILDGTVIDLCFDYYNDRTLGLKENGDIIVVDKNDSSMRFIANIPKAKAFYSNTTNGFSATVVTNDGTIYLMPCDYEYEGDPVKLEVQDNIKYLALATGFIDDKYVINYIEVFEKNGELLCDYIGCNSDVCYKDMKVSFDSNLDPDHTLTYSFFNAAGFDFIADSNGQTYRIAWSRGDEEEYKFQLMPNSEFATKDNIISAVDGNPIYLKDNALVKSDSYLGDAIIELEEGFDINNIADFYYKSGTTYLKMKDETIQWLRFNKSDSELSNVYPDIYHQIKEIAGDYVLSTDGEIYWR